MPLSIKHPEVGRLARALAVRETGRRSLPTLKQELLAISDRCAALPDYDVRNADKIIGFDEHGVPAQRC